MYDQIMRRAIIASLPVMASVSLGSLFVHPIGVLHYIVWGVTLLTIPFSALGVRNSLGEYLGKQELSELRRRHQQQTA